MAGYDKRDNNNNNGAHPPPPVSYSVGPPAAYPYPGPPPLSSYPTTFYQEPTPTTVYYQPSIVSSFYRFLTLLSFIVAVLTITLLIAYLILKPRVPEFQINSASLTSLSLTGGSQLTAGWNITVVVLNPNKKLAITYDQVSARVFYGGSDDANGVLTATRLRPVSLATRSVTWVGVNLEVIGEYVDNGVVNGIAFDRARGLVKFGVVFTGVVRYYDGNGIIFFHPKDYRLKVVCNPLIFQLSSNNATAVNLLRGGGLTCST